MIIQPANAVFASRYLLNLEAQAIEHRYEKSAATIVEQLKLAQRQYFSVVYKKYAGVASSSDAEERLSTLAETATHLANLLSKESQERLLADLHFRQEIRALYCEEMH